MPAPDTPESVVARLRPHGRALFWPTFALILIASRRAISLGVFRRIGRISRFS